MVHTLVEDQHDYRAIFGLIDISAPAVTINRQEEICDSPMRMNGTVLRRRRGSGVPVRSWLITSQACNLSILILGPSLRGQRSYESLSHDLSQFLSFWKMLVWRPNSINTLPRMVDAMLRKIICFHKEVFHINTVFKQQTWTGINC